MKKLTASLIFTTIFLLLAATAPAEDLFTVTRISDGDTVTCQGYSITFKVRLAGIDAPEKGSKKRPGQPYAEQARKYLIVATGIIWQRKVMFWCFNKVRCEFNRGQFALWTLSVFTSSLKKGGLT